MSTTRILFSVLGATMLTSGVLGCTPYGEMRTVLRAQFASELNCPEVKIQRRAVWYSYEGPDQYKISGCGVMRTYTCPKTDGLVSYDEEQCKWVEGDADAPTINRPDDGDMIDEAAEHDAADEMPDDDDADAELDDEEDE